MPMRLDPTEISYFMQLVDPRPPCGPKMQFFGNFKIFGWPKNAFFGFFGTRSDIFDTGNPLKGCILSPRTTFVLSNFLIRALPLPENAVF